MRFLLCIAAVLFIGIGAFGQCVDPPTDGSYSHHLGLQYQLSDGYLTQVDVRLPTTAPGVCGWPVVLVIHGAGYNRGKVGGHARRYAEKGYLSIAYDVRGQGTSMGLNDSSVYGRGPLGLRERIDLFEILEETKIRFSAEMDMNRVGIFGNSQGGFLAWAAAAHSGRLPPANIWRSAPFPEIKAIATKEIVPVFPEIILPEFSAFTEAMLNGFYSQEIQLHHDPVFFNLFNSLTIAEDFVGLQNLFGALPYGGPELDITQLLRTSSVPALATVSMDDCHFPNNGLLEMWNDILPGTPKLLNVTNGGHDSPKNTRESAQREFRRDQWFEHFLKGVQNGIDQSPPLRFVVRPGDTSELIDEESLWNFQEFSDWPPSTVESKFWLCDGGRLEPAQGTTPIASLVSQNWNVPYSIQDYLLELPDPSDLLNKVSLDSIQFETTPFLSDSYLCGMGTARLYISSDALDFQTNISVFDIDSSGNEQFLMSGFKTIRGNQYLGVPQPLDFNFDNESFLIKKGHSIRIYVENLAYKRAPSGHRKVMRGVPVFEDFDFSFHYGGTWDTWISLPIKDDMDPTLVTSAVKLEKSTPQDFRLSIFSDSSKAGWGYTIFAGVSGMVPGFIWNNISVPLNADWLTKNLYWPPQNSQYTWTHPGIFPVSNFSGTLDSDGRSPHASVLEEPFARFSQTANLHWPFGELVLASALYPNSASGVSTNAVQIPVD